IAVLPHFRRALWESELRKCAVTSRLKPYDINHAGDNSSCVLIKAGELILTGHYVDGPDQHVRFAKSRQQNAGVNSWLDEYTDERLLTSPLPKIDQNSIYLNLIHGANFRDITANNRNIDATSCFLRVTIPAASAPEDEAQVSEKYLYNWSVEELVQFYTLKTEIAVVDRAHPRRKTKIAKVGNSE
ncbi:MAG: hypothetical protein LC754_19430, partial [Acidobacteria bacterium]|nr:hypothetical protein [Acidobacteriota bacterium]